MSEDFGSKQIIRGTAVTSLLTVLSRILGFFRDLIVALVFGAGPIADAYFVAFRIPNLLRSFVAEGALSSAFVPIFSAEARKGNDAAQAALRCVTTFLVLTTITLTIIGIIFAESLVDLIAPGFSPEQRILCVLLTRIMLPYIIFVSIIAMINGALSSLKTFGAAAAAQSVMNLVLIAGGLLSALCEATSGAIVLSVSVLVGGIAQVLYQIPALRRANLSLELGFSHSGTIIRELVTLMAPALIGATVYQLILFSATVMASLLEAGAVSWLFYADRIVQLPIGIFSIALGSVLLPALSANVASLNQRKFTDNLLNSLRYTSFILIPLSFLIFITAPDLITVLFRRGAFDDHAASMTAVAVQALSLGIWAISCQSLLMRAFIAKRDNVTPTLLGLLTLVANLFVSLMLMGEISSTEPSPIAAILGRIQQLLLSIIPISANFGHIGLALASSTASVVSFLAIALFFNHRNEDVEWKLFTRATIFSLIAAMAASAASVQAGSQITNIFLRLMVEGTIFLPVFFLAAVLLRCHESNEILTLLRKRFSRAQNK